MMTPLEERNIIGTELGRTLVVEAAAGTGKTTELVGRIVRLLEEAVASIDQIVAVTFSEKAAGELKLRLREELERGRARHPARSVPAERLARAVYDFEEAHVSTIHGFCADLLRERPVEARVDPAFAVLTETQAARLFDDAFTGWLHAALADPGEGVRRSLRRPTRWNPDEEEENGPIERLRRAAWDLTEWRDYDAAWTRPDWDRHASVLALADQLRAFSEYTSRPLKKGDNFARDTLPARRTSEEIERLRRIDAEDLDVWEAALIALAEDRNFARPRKGSGAAFAAGVSRESALAAHAALVGRLTAFRADANADLAALLREEMRDCLARYEERKQRAGALDFLDLLIKARNLVRDSDEVRAAFRRRFRVLLVDEFQDTDPLQAELLLLLAGEDVAKRSRGAGRTRPGALFIVGDPKQSIYRFRRADVGAYAAIAARLTGDGAREVTLQTSYRAVPAIQRFVNAAFSDEMTGDADTLQARYVPLAAHRRDHPEQPALVALPLARPYGRRDVTQGALAECQPRAIGEFVRWLVSDHCAWTVDAPDPADPASRVRRRIAPRDICLLFRRFMSFGADVTRDYVEALEARGVPHLLVGGRTFHEREEVDAVRTALTAIEWPEDELSVYATVHGPLFAIGEEELLEYHAVAGCFHPYRVSPDLPERLQPVAQALETLRALHASRNHRPVADTIGRLIAATRAHAGFILWRGGEQVLANVLHISDLARRYEGEGGLSFRGFVDLLREAAGTAEAPEAPILEEGSEGVRLMTVHKAKGLEFPVVILADIGCRLSRDEASRHLDAARSLCAIRIGGWAPLDLVEHNATEAARDAAEGVRLAYVAATRARDLLVVPAVGDAPYDRGWLQPLNRALYPPVAARQDPTDAPGVPAFSGKDTVLLRPDGQQPDEATVRPGAYGLTDPVTGEPYIVVWWDPLLIEDTADDGRGLRREDLISRDAPAEVVAADRATYDAWTADREATRRAGAQPSLQLQTVTEFAEHPAAAHIESRLEHVVVEDVGLVDERPSGRRFGTLVHAMLAAVPLGATVDEVRAMAEAHARLLGATDEERAVAAATVHRALTHPRLVAARAAESAGRRVWRELPLSIVIAPHPLSLADQPEAISGAPSPAAPGRTRSPLSSPVLVDGQCDLAYEDEDGFVIVDFKTDVVLSTADEVYRRQVAVYAEALERATGRPARGVLLRT
ncbi:MAG: UvrD-helicase domain-containing protein [Acidobacteriota bacterium]|nr:UvrD-helicase domain-containing protein [Acidobacteriota bacterium]